MPNLMLFSLADSEDAMSPFARSLFDVLQMHGGRVNFALLVACLLHIEVKMDKIRLTRVGDGY